MAKEKKSYMCSDCGFDGYPRWQGQCSECGQWNTIVEFKAAKSPTQATHSTKTTARSGYAGAASAQSKKLSDVKDSEVARFSSGSKVLDRLMGGGTAYGSVNLLSGSPGAGKSTILIQTACFVSQSMPTLYVTGEESAEQVKARGVRLGLNINNVNIMTSGDVDEIAAECDRLSVKFLIVDSIQTAFLPSLDNSPGSVTQVKESAAFLTRKAKADGISVFLVGHETKDGSFAGPQTLSHIIDGAFKLETEIDAKYRTMKPNKNRYGGINVIGTFAMMSDGLKDVTNPSAIYLEHSGVEATGNMAYAYSEDNRTLLVNMQGLVSDSTSEKPERGVIGIDYKRLNMLLAIMRTRMGVMIGFKDIYANVVGGVNLTRDVGCDLPLVMSLMSSHQEIVFPNDTIAFGEVGLNGEVRPVRNGVERVEEAVLNGFKTIILPKKNYSKELTNHQGIAFIPVEKVSDLGQAMEVGRRQAS